jgi:hypothetical protein
VDLNSVSSIESGSPTDLIHNKPFNHEVYKEQTDVIRQQFQNFDSLGYDFLKDVTETQFRSRILRDFIDYSIENYLTISNYDEVIFSVSKTVQIGEYLYSFLMLDCYNIFIPNYLANNKLNDLESFDNYYNKVLINDPIKFKKEFLGVIKNIVTTITRLMNIAQETSKDKNYVNLMVKFAFYLELVNFCDPQLFLEGYFHPVLNRYSEDLVWRSN